MYFRISILSIAIFLFSCTNPQSSKDNLKSQLKHQKFSIDSLATSANLLLFVKTPDKKDLQALKKGETYPGKIEASYNVLKDSNGKIVYIAEIPFSPKDDWFIAYKSYFDKHGKLFAFQRQNNFFHSECTKGAALENLIRFYGEDFSVIDSSYTLTDSNKKQLDKATCKFPYDFPYTVVKTLEEYKRSIKTEQF